MLKNDNALPLISIIIIIIIIITIIIIIMFFYTLGSTDPEG